MKQVLLALYLVITFFSPAADPDAIRAFLPPGEFSPPPEMGRKLLGTKAPDWTVKDWLNSKSLSLADLKGKVVLVRWWTAPGCPYCTASSDALNEFWREYKDKGLVVVGLYHHKSREPLKPGHIQASAERFGFKFPVANDEDWKTLNRWWLSSTEKGWTSVTFLLDQDGVIRHIHPGGAFFKGEPGHKKLKQTVDELIGRE